MARRSKLVVGDGDASPGGSRWVVARPVAQFTAVGLAAVVIVGLATLTASRRVGQREAITDARTTTLVKAQGLVEPAVTDTLAAGDPAAVAAVGDVIEDQVVDTSLVRVKIWTENGTIVYSNDHRLEGAQYPLGDDELNALRNGLIKADVSDLTKPENQAERTFGKLLEVYLPIRSPNGNRLLFEAYYQYSAVYESGRRIWRSFAPIALGSLVVLELVQIPLAIGPSAKPCATSPFTPVPRRPRCRRAGTGTGFGWRLPTTVPASTRASLRSGPQKGTSG